MHRTPSLHLSWKELACKDGTPYPEQYIHDGTLYRLAMMFEAVRIMCGGHPLVINSAFRTHSWNQKIGGARFSQHLVGCALDIEPPNELNVTEFYNMIHANHRDLGVYGIGKYNTFVHCDIRKTPNGRLVVWSGNGTKDSRNVTAGFERPLETP